MKITFNEKEYTIKFGYKATVKSGIIKKIAKSESIEDEFDALENTLTMIPELLVVGLQVYHSDEFGYNLDTNEGFDEQVGKCYALLDEWLENKDNNFLALYRAIESELLNDSFLSSLFQREEQKATKTAKATTKK